MNRIRDKRLKKIRELGFLPVDDRSLSINAASALTLLSSKDSKCKVSVLKRRLICQIEESIVDGNSLSQNEVAARPTETCNSILAVPRNTVSESTHQEIVILNSDRVLRVS